MVQTRQIRANGAPRNITGPQSALTDFLASHNISARQIRDEADQRRQAAAQQAETQRELEPENQQDPASTSVTLTVNEPGSAKKKEERKAIAKIKQSKTFKKRKKDAVDSDEDDDDIALAIFNERHAPLPGQFENCEICSKRFTVTPYSVTGPNGGLLCAGCGRKVAKERQADLPKNKVVKKQAGGVGSRRTVQSRLLDGQIGTKSLATLCVEKLAQNIELAESLGDLPEHLVDKIARIFSKRRLLKAETLPLFVQPTTEVIHIYDGAKLGEQELISIFQTASRLKDFKARSVVQFKDSVMDYVLSRGVVLEKFYLHGANLLSEEKWHEFLTAKGKGLKELRVYYTDRHFGDDTIGVIQQHCPNLKRLKIQHNQKLTDDGIKALGTIPSLEHIGIQLLHNISSEAITHFLPSIGPNLKTLSLEIVPNANDTVLAAIHDNCRNLSKLRLTESEEISDAGFTALFTNWKNPPLQYIDLQKCRYVSASNPRNNEHSIGLCSDGFRALMAHSGIKLETLNIHACRHISREAFEEVFGGTASYPELKKLEISFCEEVTDYILGCIFKSCPSIREVNVFGCMKVRHVRVPFPVIVVGVPNAQGMITEGIY